MTPLYQKTWLALRATPHDPQKAKRYARALSDNEDRAKTFFPLKFWLYLYFPFRVLWLANINLISIKLLSYY
jgi:hypothetical protein